MPIESNISPLTRKSTPVPNDVASTTAPPKIETEQKLTTIDKVLQNKTVVTAAIKTGLYVPFRDGRLTEQKAVELAYKNDDFKRTLEQELETNHLLDQWRVIYNAYAATKKPISEASVAAKMATKSADAIQDGADYANNLSDRLNRMVRPRKAKTNEFFTPKDVA